MGKEKEIGTSRTARRSVTSWNSAHPLEGKKGAYTGAPSGDVKKKDQTLEIKRKNRALKRGVGGGLLTVESHRESKSDI